MITFLSPICFFNAVNRIGNKMGRCPVLAEHRKYSPKNYEESFFLQWNDILPGETVRHTKEV